MQGVAQSDKLDPEFAVLCESAECLADKARRLLLLDSEDQEQFRVLVERHACLVRFLKGGLGVKP